MGKLTAREKVMEAATFIIRGKGVYSDNHS